MPRDLAAEVRAFAAMMESLPLYDEWMEVTSALVWRDVIHEALAEGATLPPNESAVLEQADSHLVKSRELIMRRFPEVFDERGAPREYWWWHLDEGPQVREQALAEAKKG